MILANHINSLDDLVKIGFLKQTEYGYDFTKLNTHKHFGFRGLREFINNNFSLGETEFCDWILHEVHEVKFNGMFLYHFINLDLNISDYIGFWFRFSESIFVENIAESSEFPLNFYFDNNLMRIQTNYIVVNIRDGITQMELQTIVLAILTSQFEITKNNLSLS